MQRRNQVVKAVALIIEARGALAGDFGQQLRRQLAFALRVALRHISHHFQRIKRATRIAADQFGDHASRIVGQKNIAVAVAARFVLHRLIEHLLDIFRGQRFQQIDARTGEQRGVEFERRVFGRGADKSDGAVFDMRQKRILLTFVEAMHFVDEQNGAAADLTAMARPLDRLADLFDARGDGGDTLDVGIAVARDNLRQRGFTCTRRPPKNHRVQMASLDCAGQGLAGRQQMLLPDILLKRFGAHARRQRLKIFRGEIQRQITHAHLTDAGRLPSPL